MASKTVKLPSGAEVVLKDPKTLRVRDRKKVFEQASNAKEGIMQALSLSDGLLAILIESWTLDLIIPSVRIESIDEMEMADYDYLTQVDEQPAYLMDWLISISGLVKQVESDNIKS
jgi:hypothetical protein